MGEWWEIEIKDRSFLAKTGDLTAIQLNCTYD